jgi:hypothetical protein
MEDCYKDTAPYDRRHVVVTQSANSASTAVASVIEDCYKDTAPYDRAP